MNEHIEQYLKQHFCRDYSNSYGETVEDEHYFMYREEVEGLIELIVRECVNEIHVADVGDLKGKSYYLDKVAEHIEKHFGVEE